MTVFLMETLYLHRKCMQPQPTEQGNNRNTYPNNEWRSCIVIKMAKVKTPLAPFIKPKETVLTPYKVFCVNITGASNAR